MADEESSLTLKDRIKMFNQDEKSHQGNHASFKRGGSRKKPQNGTALFEKPHQLITTDTETNQLQYVKETLDLLQRIDKQVNVVAVTGVYRTGKSYLLNRLAGGSTGFGIGKTSNACTQGIWIWCRDHPVQTDQILVLMDVEGFGDIHKFLENLESNLCYVDRKIDLDVFDFYFPKFILCLRDFNLQVTTSAGTKTTSHGYFEEVLSQQKGDSEEIKKYNRIRLLIRNYFKNRTCFTFKLPCLEPGNMEAMDDKDLNKEFLKNLKAFKNYVYSCRPMEMISGQPINGRMFATLVRAYLDHISEGKTPCIRTAFKEMTNRENEVVLEESSIIYSDEMKRRLATINPNNDGLKNNHEMCMEKASEYFKEAIVFDDEQICFKQMQVRFRELFDKFKGICDRNSELRCLEVLNRLNLKIVQKLKDNVYAKEGGYDEYIDDLNTLQKQYDETCGLGTQSQKSLQRFFDGKSEEEEMVYRLVMEASRDAEQKIPQLVERKTSIIRPRSHYEELSTQIEDLRSRLSQVYAQKQGTTYEEIKKKNIEKMFSQLQEIERQLQEEVGENIEALECERNYLTKLIGACENPDLHTGELEEKLGARRMEIDPAQKTDMTSSEQLGETIYEVPWEFQQIRLPPEGSADASDFKEKSYASPVPRKRFCFIQ